jgi:hypothetical protein
MKNKTGISPWLAAAREALSADGLSPVYHREREAFRYNVYNEGNALWVVVCWRNDCRVALRTAFVPEGSLQLERMEEEGNGILFFLKTIIGSY